MILTRRSLVGTAAAAATIPLAGVRAQQSARGRDATIRLGVLTDMSGTYKDTAGPVSVACARLAAADFAAMGKSAKVEVLQADHQNKPDLAAQIARQWFDQGVDVILDGTNSACGLAIAGVAKEKDGVHLNSGAATSDLTGSQCNANTMHWTYDTYELGKSTGGALVKAGGDSWFFVTADYAFGHALQRDTTGFITAAKGKVLGSVAYPFPGTTDFSSYLLQAQSSGAKVIGFANAGLDTVNCIKQAKEFGISQKMTVAALLCFLSDVHAIGLETAQGLVLTNSFYWDHNDRTRAFSKRLEPMAPGVRATMTQSGVYSAGLAYLKTADQMGIAASKKSGATTVAAMKKIGTVDDDVYGTSTLRQDGQVLHPSYLWKVKTPAESKNSWDLLKPISSLAAADAFRPLGQGGCTLSGS